MKAITLVNSEWYRTIPARKRRYFLSELYDLAEAKGWTIRVKGEHYGQGN